MYLNFKNQSLFSVTKQKCDLPNTESVEIPQGFIYSKDEVIENEKVTTYLTLDELNKKLQSDYKSLRKLEYDKLNQYELQYNDMANGTNTWVEAIEAIKEQYPKA